MPNLTDLPSEIFNIILSHSLGDDEDVPRLCELALLSRKWYAALIDRIYSEWTFNGAKQPFLTLWKFLRTILRDPHLAAQVRTLRIGNWGFFPDASVHGPDLQLPPDELDLVRRAIHDAGIDHLEKRIITGLRKRDRRPLMAILLTRLSNLETLFAHVPRSDPFLASVLKQAVENWENETNPQPALHKLHRLHICQETPVDTPKQPEDSEPDSDDEESVSREALRLEYLWPVFRLRNLQELSMVGLDTDKAAFWLEDGGISHIEGLYLISNWRSICTYPDLQALIGQPKALKNFTLTINDNPFDARRNIVISNVEIWNCLQKHQQTLKTIDICRSRQTHRDDNGNFGLLCTFPKLKHIRIQSEILLGGCCGSPPAPFRLKDTLPRSLETLTLHGEEGFGVIPDIPLQLMELISGENQLPYLTAIVLDDIAELYEDFSQELKPQYQILDRLCKDRGVDFWIRELIPSIGGVLSYQAIWGKALDMQLDGEARNMAVSYNPKKLRDRQELILHYDHTAVEAGVDSEDEYEADVNTGINETRQSEPIPFTDHTGKTAYMVFGFGILPPLFSFAIYFTHPDATPENTDMKALEHQITPEKYTIRHDVYYLPGANTDECISHYHDEKEVRGSYKDQIKAFRATPRDEIHPLPGTAGQIPGMVNRYPMLGAYRSLLFISPDENWRNGLLCVMFDRKNSAENEVRYRLANSPPPPVLTTRYPLNQTDPTYSPGENTIWETVFDLAHREQDKYHVPWQRAGNRGWTTW
ncbi:hypothetical protein ASPVEDRAFT_44248 [Aspergillus versicolor CBS 583.65]|uniref:F-box domain-containing protein n=1 Tax=Aspergillus versicolor CBS 583.65 TaxID=1036611 RepID=A0A1L9PTF5_ASPVE|nr:uncharacterized protein ASPVEDRAFT_44248 [Aspergillus versicolor CBS 583.65]OJJ04715.1 hypothetical protein ASPVEDRAFT_44248 [Aspergillus versicolor CBS 583.65]